MPSQNIRIKQQNAILRGYLTQLAGEAYLHYLDNKNSDAQYLDLNIAQAKKYNRFQFLFDPKNGYEKYKNLFEAVFKENPEAIFHELKNLHPYGVEIWVTPPDAKVNPLIESTSISAANSIMSASRSLLAELKQQFDITNNYLPKDQNQIRRLNTKYTKTLATIFAAYNEAVEKIAELYDQSDFSKASEKEQYKAAEATVYALQEFVVAQLAMFSQPEGTLPDHKAYKHIFKELTEYEQRTKLQNFYLVPQEAKQEEDDSAANQALQDPEGENFNRDIFALDITYNNTDKITGEIHYYDRKYTLTPQQIEFKALSEGKVKEAKLAIGETNPYVAQPTATAHSPDYLLANSAHIEEGKFELPKNTKAESDPTKLVRLDLISTRHGSPAPVMFYKKGASRHEATYRALLNMEQHLQKVRSKIIESILREKNIKLDDTPSLAQAISFEITNLLHLDFTKELKEEKTILETAISKSCKNLKSSLSENITEALMVFENDVINVKNIHTHLITAAGIGSLSANQRTQFMDASIAQYATRRNDAGYVYMTNGINMGRYDTFTFDPAGHLFGNNTCALVELTKVLLAKKPQLFEVDFTEYDKRLATVRASANKYIEAIEKDFMKTKALVLHTERTLAQQQATLKQLKDTRVDKKMIADLEAAIKKSKLELTGLKSDLKGFEKDLTKKRKSFRSTEKKLLHFAKWLNTKIANQFNKFQRHIEGLANIPDQAQLYLAYKALELVETLFTSNAWKNASNIGVMQALVNLAAEQLDISSSYGCKSNNDRALLLALLISELAKITPGTGEKLSKDYLDNLLANAQKAYAWHISRQHTVLDRSAIPKTGSSILQEADTALKEFATQERGVSKLASHKQTKKLAADQRKKIQRMANMQTYSMRSKDKFAELFLKSVLTPWQATSSSIQLTHITTALQLFNTEQGLTDVEKLEKLQTIQKNVFDWQTNSSRDKSFDKEVELLANRIERYYFILQDKIQPENNSAGNLRDNLILLKTFVEACEKERSLQRKYYGEGWNNLVELFDEENILDQGKDIYQLVTFFIHLRNIAHPRLSDFTHFFAERNMFSMQEKRPMWLRELYKLLQTNVAQLHSTLTITLNAENFDDILLNKIKDKINLTSMPESFKGKAEKPDGQPSILSDKP